MCIVTLKNLPLPILIFKGGETKRKKIEETQNETRKLLEFCLFSIVIVGSFILSKLEVHKYHYKVQSAFMLFTVYSVQCTISIFYCGGYSKLKSSRVLINSILLLIIHLCIVCTVQCTLYISNVEFPLSYLFCSEFQGM